MTTNPIEERLHQATIRGVDPPELYEDAADEIRTLRRRVEELSEGFDLNVERLKACEHIAEGDEGWERLADFCPSTAAVALLRRLVLTQRDAEVEKDHEALRAHEASDE